MNHHLLTSLTATLLITNLSASSGLADQTDVAEQAAVDPAAVERLNQLLANADTLASAPKPTHIEIPNPGSETNLETEETDSIAPRSSVDSETPAMGVAKVQAHDFQGRRAATLYVRNIPVLTFLGTSSPSLKSGQASDAIVVSNLSPKPVQASSKANGLAEGSTADSQFSLNQLNNDPIWRAMTIAAELNYLHQQPFDAKTITVKWNRDGHNLSNATQSAVEAAQPQPEQSPNLGSTHPEVPALNLAAASPSIQPPNLTAANSGGNAVGDYVIKVGDRNLVVMDTSIILPDTTKNPDQDALQATNRLRRLLGNAPPLPEVIGKPVIKKEEPRKEQISLSGERFTGMASWYGPGFHGNYSANGEVFNQYALTAAHLTLPFGTRVKVTNLDNGRSVIVRINDRGPYAHGRVIDLSAAAAEAIGMISSGVAPVQLDVVR